MRLNPTLAKQQARACCAVGSATREASVGAGCWPWSACQVAESRVSTMPSPLCVAPSDCSLAGPTVKVSNDKLRIDLHSPLPDAAVSEYKTELSLRGTLAREAQGTIRSLESVQLQLVYALTALLEQLDGLKRW